MIIKNSRYLCPIETISREALRAIQEGLLIKAITYAYENLPVVKETWLAAGVSPEDIGSIDDFVRTAPFLQKDMLRDYRERTEDPFCGMLGTPFESLNFFTSSSGTTGDPTIFPITGIPEDHWSSRSFTNFSSEYWYSSAREFWEFGLRPGDYFLCMFPPMRGPTACGAEMIGATSIFIDHYPSEMPRFVELSLRYRPKLASMISTPLILALEEIEEQTGIDMRDVFSSYSAVVFGGEPLSVRLQGLMKRWNVTVINMATAADTQAVYECMDRKGLHVWEDQVLIECIDQKTGRHVGTQGVGELVATSLTSYAAPLIRYRSEDLVEYTEAPCTCGRTHARFKVLGRLGDMTSVNGKVILPLDIWGAVENIPETRMGLFQIIRPGKELSELKVRIGFGGNPDREDLRQRLVTAIANAVNVVAIVELVPNEALLKLGPPHKIPRTAKA